MRKRIISQTTPPDLAPQQGWLDLQPLAQVELTSEDSAHPIEAALLPHAQGGWCAAQAGAQTIRLLFEEPQRIQRIHLAFEERENPRSQEFGLRWSSGGGNPYYEIVRQQYNFSPPVTTKEVEDYTVDLEGVRIIELQILPEINGGEAKASLQEWYLA